jgi:outer membrane murein-binding lipoprotein Lpp
VDIVALKEASFMTRGWVASNEFTRVCEQVNAILKEDWMSYQDQQMMELAARVDQLESERDALQAAIRAYVVAMARAPNNRDEAEIDAAARGLVQALEDTERKEQV